MRGRVEIITGPERRRPRSVEEKLQLVERCAALATRCRRLRGSAAATRAPAVCVPSPGAGQGACQRRSIRADRRAGAGLAPSRWPRSRRRRMTRNARGSVTAALVRGLQNTAIDGIIKIVKGQRASSRPPVPSRSVPTPSADSVRPALQARGTQRCSDDRTIDCTPEKGG